MEMNNEHGNETLPFTLRRFHISEDYGFLLPNPLVGKQAVHAACGQKGDRGGGEGEGSKPFKKGGFACLLPGQLLMSNRI